MLTIHLSNFSSMKIVTIVDTFANFGQFLFDYFEYFWQRPRQGQSQRLKFWHPEFMTIFVTWQLRVTLDTGWTAFTFLQWVPILGPHCFKISITTIVRQTNAYNTCWCIESSLYPLIPFLSLYFGLYLRLTSRVVFSKCKIARHSDGAACC